MNLHRPINRTLSVPLTNEEKTEFGRKLAHLHDEHSTIEREKKYSADQFKNRLEQVEGRISYFSRVVRDGEEYREVECRWRYLFEANTKELIRMDAGEIVETEPITSEERQLMLQMEHEKDATEAAEAN